MHLSTYMNLAGLALNLSGFLVLVKEIRYAHLTEYHSINLEQAAKTAEEFKQNPGKFIKQTATQIFGEKVVNLYGEISDSDWQKWANENKEKYEEKLTEAIRHASEWKKKVPPTSLKLRMRWLTIGATLVVSGALLQGVAAIVQAAN